MTKPQRIQLERMERAQGICKAVSRGYVITHHVTLWTLLPYIISNSISVAHHVSCKQQQHDLPVARQHPC